MCSARAHTHAITRKTAHAPCQPTSAPGLHCTYTKRHTARTAHRTCTKHPGSSMGLDGGLVAVARLEEQSHVRHRPLPSSNPQYLPHHFCPRTAHHGHRLLLCFSAQLWLGQNRAEGGSCSEQATCASSIAMGVKASRSSQHAARLSRAWLRVRGMAAREQGGAPAPSAQRYSAPKT